MSMGIDRLKQLEELMLEFMLTIAPNAQVISNARRAITRTRKAMERELDKAGA
jgi:hypothetical protein